MAKRSFFDHFPTPKFLEMPSPGVTIEKGKLRFVEFNRLGKFYFLKEHETIDLSPDAFDNGEINKPEEIKEALADLKKRHDLKYVRSVIPEEKGYIFSTTIPRESETNVTSAIEFSIEENVPLSLTESVHDYLVLNTGREDALEVSVAVVPEAVVLMYLDLYRSVGLSPLHFEMESQAIAKAAISRDDKDVHLILHFFAERAVLGIVRANGIHFSSTLPILLPENGEAPRPQIDALIGEIKKAESYWSNNKDKFGSGQITNIIVSGKIMEKSELLSVLSDLGLPVVQANVWTNAFDLDQYVPDITRLESLKFAATVGVGLPHRLVID